MLSIESFWRGSDKDDRRRTYWAEYKPRATELEANAAVLLPKIQEVADLFEAETHIVLTTYSSGWRPAAVNDATANSGKLSSHMEGKAGDVKDTPTGQFAWWCFLHQDVLRKHKLYMEHPCATVLMAKATPWTHLSTRPPKSGSTCFHPSNSSLLTWNEYVAEGGKPEGGPLVLRPKR